MPRANTRPLFLLGRKRAPAYEATNGPALYRPERSEGDIGRGGPERSEGPTQGLRVINRLNHRGLGA